MSSKQTKPSTKAAPQSGAAKTANSNTQQKGAAPAASTGNKSAAPAASANKSGAPAGQMNNGMGGGPMGMGGPMGGPMGMGGGNSMYGMGGAPGGNSMYGMGGAPGGGSMYGMGGPSSMYGMGGQSMNGGMSGYGMGGSAYGGNSFSGQSNGSQYSFSMMPVSSIMGDPIMGSIYGQMLSGPSGRGGHFGGSLYGGSMFGSTGNLYGTGGSLYGGSDMGSIVGSMYGMGSMYESYQPHTALGVVRKADVPFSYTFQSGLGNGLGQSGLSSRPSAFMDMRNSMHNSFRSQGSSNSIGSTGPRQTRGFGETSSAGTRATAKSASPSAASKKSQVNDGTSQQSQADKSNVSQKSRGDVSVPTSPKSNKTSHLNVNSGVHTAVLLHKTSSTSIKHTANELTVGKTTARVTEVVECDTKVDVPVKCVGETLDHVVVGHAAAILLCDDGKSEKSVPMFLRNVIKQLFDRIQSEEQKKKAKFSFQLNVVSLKDLEVRDLLKSGSTFAAMEPGGSPLVGPTVCNIDAKSPTNVEQFSSSVAEGLANSTPADKLILCTALVKRVQEPEKKGGERDVAVSAFNILVSSDGPKTFNDIAANSKQMYAGVFRQVFGGSCFTSAVMLIQDSNSACGPSVQEFEKLGKIKNSPPRSGNVRRFINFTQQEYEKKAGQPEQARLKMIIEDSQKLIDDPNANIRVYVNKAYVSKSGKGQEDTPDDTRISSILIPEVASCKAFKVKGTQITSGGSTFDFTEVVKPGAGGPTSVGSTELARGSSLFSRGYNCALLSFDSEKFSRGPFDSPCWLATREAVESVSSMKCDTMTMRAGITFMKGNMSKDAIGDHEWSETTVSASPVYGPVIEGTQLHRIQNSKDLDGLLEKAKKSCGNKWEKDVLIHCIVVAFFMLDGDGYACSFLTSTVPLQSAKMYADAASNAPSLGPTFRYALGGTCSTKVLCTVHSSDSEQEVLQALQVQKQLTGLKSRRLRKGSIGEFIKFTEDTIKQRQAVLNDPKTSDKDKQTLMKHLMPMQKMSNDYADALKNPTTVFPATYSAPSDAAPGSRDSQKCKLVGFVPRPTNRETSLTIDGTEFAFDELVQYEQKSDGMSTKPSVVMAELEKDFIEGHNCAILAASALDVHCAEEAAWMYFKKAVSSAFVNKSSGDKVYVDLAFAIVSESRVETDLISGSSKDQALRVHLSPLANSKIEDIEIVLADSEEKVENVIRGALDRAVNYMPDIRNGSLLMVGYAFLRRLTKGKLFVNSLVCTLSGSQAMPYKEVLDRASIPRVRLFQGPLQGPSRTVGCISYGKVDTSTRMMTTVLSQIGKVKVASSVRSVNDFITENEESLKRTAKRLSGTSLDSGEKVTLTTKADRIKSLLNDHKGLLSNPQQPLPFYKDEQMNSQASQNSRSRGGKSHSSQNPSRLATVAIVTKGRSGGNNTVEVVDETNIKANGENVPFSEVVARPDNAATIRSVKMDDMTDLSLSAHNTAVLMSETPGSKACLAFASRMVRNILSKMPARSEVFYNIYGQKDDGTVKDFVTGDDYKKRAIMTSPLFGPCFENAPMEVLKSDSALEVALTKAAAECATQDAVCLAVIVFKYISPGDGKEVEDDVSLSSLLIAMDPSGTCGQYEKYLFLEKKQRGIYQCALGGSCQTLGVLGLTEDTDKPALKNALRVFNMLGAIEGTQLRNGSLRRFVDYTQFAINKMKEDLAKLPREEAEKIGKVRIPKVEVMRNDSADLLKNPVGRKPILYAAS